MLYRGSSVDRRAFPGDLLRARELATLGGLDVVTRYVLRNCFSGVTGLIAAAVDAWRLMTVVKGYLAAVQVGGQ